MKTIPINSVLIFLLSAVNVLAVSLQWDWNTEEHLGGYRVHWGTKSKDYHSTIDVGKTATFDASSIVEGSPPGSQFFFAVTAYNTDDVEGKPTNEVSYTIPVEKIYLKVINFIEIDKDGKVKATVKVSQEKPPTPMIFIH